MKIASTLLRAVALELVAVLLVGYVLSAPINHIARQLVPDAKAWTEDTHHHSIASKVHMAVKHQSREGHWLNIVCSLPDKRLDVSVKISGPIEIADGFDGKVYVSHQVGAGKHQAHLWNFNDVESLVFAPHDIDIAQRIVRSTYFYFYGQFEPHGRPYTATFDLTYTEHIHPAIAVLTACEQPLMPPLRTPTAPNEATTPPPQT